MADDEQTTRYPRLHVTVVISDGITKKSIVSRSEVTAEMVDAFGNAAVIAAAKAAAERLLAPDELPEFLEQFDPLWKKLLADNPENVVIRAPSQSTHPFARTLNVERSEECQDSTQDSK